MAEILHTNIYLNNHELNNHEADTIGNAIDRVEQFVAELEVVRSGPPRPFQVRTNSDRNRLQCVPGRRVREEESGKMSRPTTASLTATTWTGCGDAENCRCSSSPLQGAYLC